MTFFLGRIVLVAAIVLSCGFGLRASAAPTSTRLDEANGLIDAEQFQTALDVLKSIDPQSDGETAEIDRALGRIYLALNKPAKAVEFFEQALTTSTQGEADSYLGLAEARLLQGNLAQARRHAEAMLHADPDQVGAHLVLARIDQRLGRDREAMGRLETLAKAQPASEDVAMVLARYQTRAASPAAAADRLAAFLRQVPTAAHATDLLGQLYWEMNRKDDAIRTRLRAADLYTAQKREGRAAAIAAWLRAVAPDYKAVAPVPETQAPETQAPGTQAPGTQTLAPPDAPAVVVEPPLPQAVKREPMPAAPLAAPPPPSPPASTGRSRTYTALATPEPLPFAPGTSILTGSGVVLEGGRLVITNRHVVEGMKRTAVRNGTGYVRQARVVRVSSEDDLALLELSAPFPEGEAMPLSALADPTPGRPAVVMGFPLIGLLGDEQPSLAEGIVSKTIGLNNDPTSFQMTTKLNKGNSGGPVFDRHGTLIGIAVGKLDLAGLMRDQGFMAEDVNFAIKASRALRFIGRGPGGGGTQPTADVPLEDLYQAMLPRVVLIASVK